MPHSTSLQAPYKRSWNGIRKGKRRHPLLNEIASILVEEETFTKILEKLT